MPQFDVTTGPIEVGDLTVNSMGDTVTISQGTQCITLEPAMCGSLRQALALHSATPKLNQLLMFVVPCMDMAMAEGMHQTLVKAGNIPAGFQLHGIAVSEDTDLVMVTPSPRFGVAPRQ